MTTSIFQVFCQLCVNDLSDLFVKNHYTRTSMHTLALSQRVQVLANKFEKSHTAMQVWNAVPALTFNL